MKAEVHILKYFSVGVAFIFAASLTSAATYNFYFNNTEQGNNSTAAPSLSISQPDKPGEKIQVKAEDGTLESPELKKAEAAKDGPVAGPPVPTPADGQTKAVAPAIIDSVDTVSAPYSRRLFLGAALSTSAYGYSDGRGHSGLDYDRSLGGILNYSSFLSSWFGVGFTVGLQNTHFTGLSDRIILLGEFEIVPVRLSFFQIPNVMELGFLGGVNNLARGSNNVATFHVGSRVGLNLGKQFQVAAELRGNQGFYLASASLGLRF